MVIRDWTIRVGLLLLLLCTGWSLGSKLHLRRVASWSEQHDKLRVLTTIFPVYDFTREVGGKEIEIRNLLPPGVDPHEFALSPRDAELVAGADLILANGAGLDDFIIAAAKKAGVPQERVVRVAPETEAISRVEGVPETTLRDPHRWVDPVFARYYIRKIAGALISANRSRDVPVEVNQRIRKSEIAYLSRLADLDREFQVKLAPVADSGWISFHGAFENLARRYHLRVAAVWQRTPGREPAPREVGRILEIAKQEGVRALFSEPQFSPRAIEMIAADAHLPVHTLDPMETATDFAAVHYEDVMRRNLDTLVSALSSRPAAAE